MKRGLCGDLEHLSLWIELDVLIRMHVWALQCCHMCNRGTEERKP